MISFVLRLVLWLLSGASALLFAALSVQRLFYPLELDCIEGVMMDHVVRLAHGQPIYVAPSLSFIPLAYMPLFPALASLPARMIGPALWEPRLISLLAVIGIVVLIFRIVRAETESATLAAGGAALYLMGFGMSGGCYDVARPDSLMLFLALAGLAVLRFNAGQGGAAGSALLLSLALFTKQHAALFVVAAIVHLAINERHRLLVFVLWLAVGCGIGITALSYWLGPWFRFYTLDLPAHWSQLSLTRLLDYLGQRLFGRLGLLAGASVLSLALPLRPWRGRDGLWTWVGLGGLATGLLATLDPGAYRHVQMPTMLVFAVLGPISLHRIAAEMTATRAAQIRTAMGVMCGALALQFLPLLYPAHEFLPHPRAAEARAAFVAELQRLPGGVLVPYHGFYSSLAGKSTSLHIIPLDDLIRSRGSALARDNPTYLEGMFQPLREGPNRPAIVTDVPLAQSGPLWASLDSAYVLSKELGPFSETLRPVTGNRFTSRFIYVPKPSATLQNAPLGSSSLSTADSLISHLGHPPEGAGAAAAADPGPPAVAHTP